MEDIQNFQILWFVLIFILLLGYALSDGFDLGLAVLLPFLGRHKEEKDTLIASIGPVWDGNEVWLVTGGGALFAVLSCHDAGSAGADFSRGIHGISRE
jgi:cytochrome d ubiquinol oxidase subunit II